MPRLTLLLPPRAIFARVPLPAQVARVVARGDHAMHAPGPDAQLGRHFKLLPDRWSHAALTRVVDAGPGDTRAHAWLRADPAHVRPDINGARLLATGAMLGVEPGDAQALLPALRPLFGDAGFTLDAPHPTRWYVRLPLESRLPAFSTPDHALGDDVFEHTPDAPEARRWRALLSEAQVVLHNHPHNAARLQAGRAAINSLWFWGGGSLPDHVTARHPTLYSDDVLLHGLAHVGKLEAMPPCEFPDVAADALVDLRNMRHAGALLEQWIRPACEPNARDETLLDFGDGHQVVLKPAQRWRFWRRPLAALA
ncbi:MAG: phosphoglycerate mutase [Pseudomonadota bacterium]